MKEIIFRAPHMSTKVELRGNTTIGALIRQICGHVGIVKYSPPSYKFMIDGVETGIDTVVPETSKRVEVGCVLQPAD